MRSTTIGVVGGGSVGVSFLAQLVKCMNERPPAPDSVEILLFEPSAAPGGGDAYATDLNTNLLNIPVRNMSAYADDKRHFSRWLKAQDQETFTAFNIGKWNEDSFLPRPIFGRYMEEVFDEARRNATAMGVNIAHVRGRVCSVEQSERDSEWCISTETGQFHVDHTVLCNGNLPSVAFRALEGASGYFNCPYPVRALTDSISTSSTVAVIGTSLSAVDAIVALKEAGHHGRMVAVSRNGRLPSVRSIKNRRSLGEGITADQLRAIARSAGGTLTLRHVAEAMITKLHELGGELDLHDVLGSTAAAKEQLSQEIEISRTQERLWQVVAGSLNDVIDLVWHLLDETERQIFKQQWRSLWMTRRATFPMENATKLQRYLQSGQLTVHRGFKECAYDTSAEQYTVHLTSATGGEALRVDHVINATSFSLDVADSPDPLVRQLLKSGIAQPDPHGGMALDYDTGSLINRSGAIQHSISLLGSLAAGTYFWTLSMDVNARLALDQAKRLSARLTN